MTYFQGIKELGSLSMKQKKTLAEDAVIVFLISAADSSVVAVTTLDDELTHIRAGALGIYGERGAFFYLKAFRKCDFAVVPKDELYVASDYVPKLFVFILVFITFTGRLSQNHRSRRPTNCRNRAGTGESLQPICH